MRYFYFVVILLVTDHINIIPNNTLNLIIEAFERVEDYYLNYS